jgi:sulfur carrier protein
MVYEMGCQPIGDMGPFEVIVNGAPRLARAGRTLLGLLEDLEVEPSRVAIEMDRRIVKRTEWDTLELAAGARIEIVQFVGGG